MRHFAHVVQLRLTREDLVALQQMASVRELTIEDLIRGECRLPSYLDELPLPKLAHSVLTDDMDSVGVCAANRRYHQRA